MTGPASSLIVATAVDGNALLPVMALIGSLARNTPGAALVILSVGLPSAEGEALQRLAAGAGLFLRILPLNPGLIAGATLRSGHLSRTAYARLFLPDLLPGLDSVIWLDADTVILGDLAPLWAVELQDALVAAVPDAFIDAAEVAATASRAGSYFNSGVMLVNLARWRQEGLTEHARALMCSPDLICEDQSVLNRLCAGRVHLLGHRWNFHAARFAEYPPALRHIPPEVLHFCGARNPWVEEVPFATTYLRFLPPEVRAQVRAAYPSLPVARRLELAQRRLFGLILGRPKHWGASRTAVELAFAELRLARKGRAAPSPRAAAAPNAAAPGSA